MGNRIGAVILALAFGSLLGAGVAAAKDKPSLTSAAPPLLFKQVVDCRTIADAAQRLACYDKAVGNLSEAADKKEVVIVDRAAIQETKRGLFGISLPKVKLFDGNDEEIDHIESTIVSAREGSDGYILRLEDGSVWAQIDNRYTDKPKPGMSVKIRKAALGSFFCNINGAVAIRVKRVID